MPGLLIAGLLFDVPGVKVLAPGDEPWVALDAGDYMIRHSQWIRQIIIHTTKGIWPQTLRPGVGPGGKDKVVADFWRGDPTHSASQLVVDNDGTIACLCDVAKCAAYHATTANDMSVGIEMYQEADGSIYECVLDSTVALVKTLCNVLAIPFQGPKRTYNNLPLARMITGVPGERGKDCVGVFGHRDNAWDYIKLTSTRGRGDPGDAIYDRLVAAGMLAFDYDAKADLAYWRNLQTTMNAQGETLDVDGVCGPTTVAAAKKHNLWRTA